MATRTFYRDAPVSGTIYYDDRWIDPNDGTTITVMVEALNSRDERMTVYQIESGIDPNNTTVIDWYEYNRGAWVVNTHVGKAGVSYRAGARWTDGGTYPNPARLRITITYTGSLSDTGTTNPPPTTDTNQRPYRPTALQPSGLNLTASGQYPRPWLRSKFFDPDTGDSMARCQYVVRRASDDFEMWRTKEFPTTTGNCTYGDANGAYAANPIQRGVTYEIQARHWDNHGAVSYWSAVATFSYQVVNNAPNAPGNLAPSGTVSAAGTAPQPTMVSTFSDPDGSFEIPTAVRIVVRRTSDSAVMWDSGKVPTTAEERSTRRISRVYPNANLVRGVAYDHQHMHWDDSGFASAWSARVQFTVALGPTPPDPATFTPVGRINALQPTLTARYDHPDGLHGRGKHFRLYAPDGRTIVHDSGEQPATVVPGDAMGWTIPAITTGTILQNGRAYRMAVRSKDTNGAWSAWSNVGGRWGDFRINARPTVTLRAPSNGSQVTTLEPRFSWAFADPDGDRQTRFRFELFRIELNGATTVIRDVTVDSALTYYDLPAGVITEEFLGRRHRWRVTVFDNFGTLASLVSVLWTFTPTSAPTAVVVSPANGGYIDRPQHTFRHTYTPGVGGTVPQARYQYIFADPVSGEVRHSSGELAGTGTSYTPPPGILQDDMQYRLEVQVWDTNNATNISSAVVFDTVFVLPNDMEEQPVATTTNFIASSNFARPAPYLSYDDAGNGVGNDFVGAWDLQHLKSAYFDGASWINVPHDPRMNLTGGRLTSAYFDGVDDLITIPHHASQVITGKLLTLQCRFRMDGLQTDGDLLVRKISGYSLRIGTGGTLAGTVNVDNAGTNTFVTVTGTTVLANGTDYHAALTYDGVTLRVFLNGALEASLAESRNLWTGSTSPITVGAASATGNQFKGWIDEIELANVARWTAAFTPSPHAASRLANTVFLYHLDGNSLDGGPNGVHGAESGGVTFTGAYGRYAVRAITLRAKVRRNGATNASDEFVRRSDQVRIGISDTQPAGSNAAAVATLWYDNGGTAQFVSIAGGAIVDGQWHDVETTFDGETHRLFVDGTLVASRTDGRNLWPGSTNALRIGASPTATGFEFLGYVDEVELARAARHTAAFIPHNAALTPDADTVALYHLDGSSADSSGNGFHGASTGVTWSDQDDWLAEQFDVVLNLTPVNADEIVPYQRVVVTRARSLAAARVAGVHQDVSVANAGIVAGQMLVAHVEVLVRGAVTANIAARGLTSAGVVTGSAESVAVGDTAESWIRLEVASDTLAPVGTANIRVRLQVLAASGTTGEALFRHVQFEPGSVPTHLAVGDMGSGHRFSTQGYSRRLQKLGYSPTSYAVPETARSVVQWDTSLMEPGVPNGGFVGWEWIAYNVYYRIPASNSPERWRLLAAVDDPSVGQVEHVYAGSGTVYEYGVTQVVAHEDGTLVESRKKATVEGRVDFSEWYILGVDHPELVEVLSRVPAEVHSWTNTIPYAEHLPAGGSRYRVRQYGRERGVEGAELSVLYKDEEGDNVRLKIEQLRTMHRAGGRWVVKSPTGVVLPCFIDNLALDDRLTRAGRHLTATFTFSQSEEGEGL